MSWLFKSLQSNDESSEPSENPPAGIKDLSELGHTIGRQLRGVASFLAPPPKLSPSSVAADSSSVPESQLSPALQGIGNDLAEIGVSFKSGLSKFGSNFLQFQGEAHVEDCEEYGENYGDDFDDQVVGITNDIIQFVREVSLDPECWTDFPLRLDHDFRMSDIQRSHAVSIQQLVPDFAALRLRLLDSMCEEDFWMIYFIMVVQRLNEHDSKLLSTPKIVEARHLLVKTFCFSSIAQAEEGQSSGQSKVVITSSDGNEVRGCEKKEGKNSCQRLDISDETDTGQQLNMIDETNEKENPCKGNDVSRNIIEAKQVSNDSDDINSDQQLNNNDETKEENPDKTEMVEGKEGSNISGEGKQELDISDGKNSEKQLVKSNNTGAAKSSNVQRKLECDAEDDFSGGWVQLSKSSLMQEKDSEDDWFKV